MERPETGWRDQLHDLIFEAETPAGRTFDIVLLAAILTSVFAVLLESVELIRTVHGAELRLVEWVFTVLFTVEYGLRLISVRRPLRYATSFFGAVDLLAILPTYLSLLVPGTQTLIVIRAFRLLRIFRVFKLVRWLGEASALKDALRASARKIILFLATVLIVILTVGALMYLIEGRANGFTSIPRSMYWAVVTMTTVGYGDIAPQTVTGQFLASCLMVLGYGVIAVPTGIVSVELAHATRARMNTITCPSCMLEGHAPDAAYCRRCGARLDLLKED